MNTQKLHEEGLKEVQPKLVGPENYSLWKNNLFMDLHYAYPYLWKLVSEGDEKVKLEVQDFDKIKKEANDVLSERVKNGIDESLKGKKPFDKTITTDNFSQLDEEFDDNTPVNRAKALIYWFSGMTGKTRKVESQAQDTTLKWILLVDDFEELLLNVYFHYEISFEDFVTMLIQGLKLHEQQKEATFISQAVVIAYEENLTLKKRTTPIKAVRWVACTTPFGEAGGVVEFMSHSRMLFEENAVEHLGDYEQKMPYRLKFNDEGL